MGSHILIARGCVNDCRFCAVADKRRAGLFPSRGEVLRFVREAAGRGEELVLSGLGEPTLDPRFEEYLEAAHAAGIDRIRLFTTGYGLDRTKVRRWSALGLRSVLVSIHGMEQGHDRNVRRPGAFREALRALALYLEQGIKTTVNTCLTRLNLHEIPELRGLLALYPVREHTLSFPEWSGNALESEEILLDYGEVSAAARDLIPDDDRITWFENVPCCLVGERCLELRAPLEARILDGTGEQRLRPGDGKLFPEVCRERECPLLASCGGFERPYVERRGWQDLPERAAAFLDGLRAGERPDLEAVRARNRPASDTRPARGPGSDRRLTVVVKPSARCNAACRYCSAYTESTPPDMTVDLLRALYARLAEYVELRGIRELSFLWHGGEPMLMGKRFFEIAWQESDTIPCEVVGHRMQTNLLLLDEEWLALLDRFRVHVGTSVDPFGGDRILKNGAPQFPLWLDRFRLACTRGYGPGIVFTVTGEHIDRPDEVYFFFRNLQSLSAKPFYVRLSPVYPGGAAASGEVATRIDPVRYGEFLTRVRALWDRDGRRFPLAPLHGWQTGHVPSCQFSDDCQDHFLGIDSRGGVYNCGRFVDSHTPWGNILEADLAAILSHPDRRRFAERRAGLREGHCAGCRHWEDCHGGCPYEASLVRGDVLQPSPLCEAFRYYLDREHERREAGPRREVCHA